MTRPIVIVGCGGFGRETHDVIDAINAEAPTWHVVGYVDDDPSVFNVEQLRLRGTDVIGDSRWLEASGGPEGSSLSYVVAIGSPAVRRAIDERLQAARLRTPVLVHPAASLGSRVTLAPGTVVCAGARLSTNVTAGRSLHVNANCTVGHDSMLGAWVSINPLAAVSGAVVVGDETLLGAHSVVLQGLKIGSRSVVGAAACVVRDVPDDVTVKGVPARS